MIVNPATQPSDELNDFTRRVRLLGCSGWGRYKVRLRDGTKIRPYFQSAEHETEIDVFYGNVGDRVYRWNLDGTSVTRSDYDMMEIESDD